MDFCNASNQSVGIVNESNGSPDVNKILNRCERMVKGVCFEIVVARSKTDENERYLIDIDPEDEQFVKDVTEEQETLEQRLDRIENLQGIYVELWDRTLSKIEELKEQFKHTDYKIVLLKRKRKLVWNKRKLNDLEGQNQFDGYSDASTVVMDDRKSSSSCNDNIIDSEPLAKRKCNMNMDYPKISSCSKFIIIGPNGTQISRQDFEQFNWNDAGVSTRKLLILIFGEEFLAKHSLTGNQSPAFRGRERAPKGRLDPEKTSDIIYITTLKCNVSPQVVRAAITTKCADTSKKFRRIKMKL